MNQRTVYLCYQFRERALADELAAALDVSNAPLDQYDQRMRLQVASDAAAETRAGLGDAMARADAVIGIVGPTTATSSWVGWELEQAGALGRPVIIARMSPDDPMPATPGGAVDTVSGDVNEVLAAIERMSSRP